MKTNKFSRVIALLLTLVMLLGTMPTSLAEGMTIVDTAKYELSLEAAANLLYEKLMASTEYEEYADLIKVQLVEHLNALVERYGEDATAALMTHQDELLSAFQAKLQAMQLPSEVVFMTKSYTKAVPMFKKTYVAPITTYGLRSAVMPLDAGDTNDNGLELDKYVSNDGTKLYLEAYATGSTVTTVSTSSKPMDIIFVIDQSGSMESDFTNNTTSWQLYGDSINSNNLSRYNNGNIWYKVGDNEYVAVTVTRELVDESYQYAEIDSGTTNSTYYDTYRNNLYELLADGTYAQITVTYSTSGFMDSNQTYTYTFADGTSVTSSRNFIQGGAGGLVPNLGRTVYSRATTGRYVYRYSYVDSEGTRQYIGTDSEGADTAFGTTFYQRIEAGSTQHRLDALLTALNTFVGNVTEDAKGENGVFDGDTEDSDDVDHRIAIVGFASHNDDYRLNNTELLTGVDITTTTPSSNYDQYYPDGYAHNGVQYENLTNNHYKVAYQRMITEAGRDNVDEAVSALTAHGGTRPDLGMNMASNILANDPYVTTETPYDETKRGRIVILFTDGSPDNRTYGTSAINTANTLKNTYKADVYAVGIFGGANANSAGNSGSNADTADYANYFMQSVSSNNGTPAANGQTSYYLSAANSSDLNKIFDTISSTAIEGGTITELTTTTVVSDIFSSYFELPEGADEDSIKVYTDTYGPNSDAFTGNWTEFTDAGVVTGVDPTTGEDMLTVTNFNFKENWVGSEEAADGTKTYRGKKLIIEVPITPKAGFLGGNNVPTNSTADVFAPNEEGTLEWVEAFPFPDTDVEIKPIKPTINDQHIYLSNNADLRELIGLYTGTNFFEYELNKVKYPVDGINNGYVNITYTFSDDTGEIATLFIPAGKTSADASVSVQGDLLVENLTENKTYTITCTVSPTEEGTYGPQTSTANGTVYVYNPVLTFEDTEEKYLDDVKNTDYYNVNNFKLSATQWKRADGTLSTATGVSMRGTVPGITLTYDKAVEGVLLTGTQVTAKADVHVNVTEVQLAGDNPDNYANNTTVVRLVCDCAHKDPANCKHTAALTAELKDGGNNPEFIVHVYDVYGHLKITKAVEKNVDVNSAFTLADTFTFTVNLPVGTYKVNGTDVTTDSDGNLSISLKNGGSATINDLPPQTPYKITEDVPNGYVLAPSDPVTGNIVAGTTTEHPFTNTVQVGSLKITKVIKDADGNVIQTDLTDAAKFTFDVVIDGVSQTVTITGAGEAMIENIPVNAEYTVTEKNVPAGFTPAGITGATGTITANTVKEVVATNTYEDGSLSITKKVVTSGTVNNDFKLAENFTFTVELPQGTYPITGIDGQTNLVVDSTGKATITLTNGQTVTIKDIAPEAPYKITETVPNGYVLAPSDPVTGNIVAGSTQAHTFTNTVTLGTLKVVKQIVDEKGNAVSNNAVSDDEFTLDVKIGNVTYQPKIKVGEVLTYTGLPIGLAYEVSETVMPTGYTLLSNDKPSGTIGTNEIVVTIVNKYNNGSLKISKTVENNTGVTQNLATSFEFTVVLKDAEGKELTGTYNYSGSKSGTITSGGTITLASGESVTIAELPPHTTYTVTEKDYVGYETTIANVDNGTANEIDASLTDEVNFMNTVNVADLTITKDIKNYDANCADDVFTFNVTLPDGDYALSNGQTLKVTDKKGQITIAGKGSVTIKNIPIKTEYAVEEDVDSLPTGYTVDGQNGENGLLVSDKTVTITNTYTTGSLKIEKDVTGSAAPADAEFTFTVNLKAEDGSALAGSYSYTGSKSGPISNGGTITLKDGQSITIANLPAGATYTVTETSNEDYITDPSDYKRIGTISTTLSEAKFTNTYQKQILTITKVVKDSTFEEGTREFKFDVAKSDGKTEVVSIKVDASTKTKSATVLVPVGSTTVTEQLNSAAGYAVTYTYGNATSEAAPELPISYEGEWSITVTNTAHKDYENVNVTKTWVDNDNLLGERPSSITVNLVGTVNGASFDHGKDPLTTSWIDQKDNTWKAGWTAVPMFDADGNKIEYSVTENPVEKYTMTGITGNAESGFAITNAINVGDLSITKTVEDEENDGVDPTDLDFTFRVTLTDAKGNALSDISYTGAKIGKVSDGDTITLKAGQTVTLENLPEGSTYAVEEINIPVGYTLKTQTGIEGKIAAGTTAAAAFTNTFEVADLVITKKIVDENGADFAGTTKDDDVFTINVTLPAGTYAMSNGESFVSTGAAQAITITGANSVTFQNIPINTAYTVVEDTMQLPTGYELESTVDSDAGMLSDDGATVTITNTYLNGELAITKNVVNTTNVDQNRATTFDFKVTLTDASGTALTGTFNYKVTMDGAADPVRTGTISHNGTITLEHGQTATILELPPETKYTVTETVPTGYVSETTATVYNSTEGAIDAGLTDAITVTNTFNVADLTVTKVITGGDENTSDDIFTFEIELPEGTYVIEGAKTIGADGTVADLTTLSVGDDGKAMFVLVGPSTATIKNIPINTTYTVEEVELPTGYTKASEQNVSGTIPDSGVTVTVTNAYAKGGLTIEKEVIGTDAPKATETFTFTVEVKDAAGNAIAGTYAYTIGTVAGSITTGTANEAERQITLKHGEKAIFETLPTGAVVTVTETENADYVTTPALVQTSTITAVTSELKFTNTYQYGSLTISKSGIDTTLDPNAKTVYRVTGNGVDLTVVVDENGSVEINRLPLGDYTVTELTDWSWRYKATTDNPQTGTITATKNAAVAFGNERDKTQWLDGETSAENIFDPVTEQQEVSENE